ncbi:NAD-dependent epimerase/dehydratase family protein [Prevotella pectinovora]|uniref:NAD-dependent epimerase/dehydratase family protein n=1 Tax=Prevotella pectinovora TaxID=1602169 RepID=UPI0005C55698|nr:NAD-dependent epimerase/dehydratase family protein [Prevotella pectinovora]
MTEYRKDIINAAAAALPWEKLEDRNILVTGATGLIGGCLVEILMAHRERSYHVFAAGRDEKRAHARFARYWQDERFHFIKFDVSEPLAGDAVFHYIIHAASNASPVFFAKSPVEIIKSNVYGTANLIDYGRNHGMERFLYVSSGEIYGQGTGEKAFTETDSGYVDCATPRACYPSSKRAAETLCVAYAEEYGVDAVIVRPSHTYGPHFTGSDNRVFCQFIRNVLRGEDIVMKSDGSQMRSWCYVADCALAMLYVLLNGERGNAYNIADTSSVFSIREMAETLAHQAGRKVVFAIPEDAEKKVFTKISYAVFATDKLEALGWKPLAGNWQQKLKTTIREEMDKTDLG